MGKECHRMMIGRMMYPLHVLRWPTQKMFRVSTWEKGRYATKVYSTNEKTPEYVISKFYDFLTTGYWDIGIRKILPIWWFEHAATGSKGITSLESHDHTATIGHVTNQWKESKKHSQPTITWRHSHLLVTWPNSEETVASCWTDVPPLILSGKIL